jgi:hypothetical protein
VNDEVWLEIPAQPDFVFLARVVAAKLGARRGFTIDAIEDLKLALAEVLACVMSDGSDESTLRIGFEEQDSSVRITGAGDTPVAAAPELNRISKLILDALLDEYAVGVTSDGRPEFEMIKKRTGA